MNSGYHNRNKKDRRDSPSSSSRPRSSSKTSAAVNNEANQRNRTPPKSINGKMPSVANSPSSEAIITDGMANMVLEKLPYPVGSKITAKLNTGAPAMKGEIVAFDPKLKVVIIRTPGSRPGHHNVSILNLANCAEIKVDEECKESPGGPMPEVNIQKLDERRKMQIERKKKLITAFKAGISPDGQKLFQYINRTIDEILWHGEKILVMNKVIIEPPYRPENVRIKQGVKEDESTLKNLNHIRKIVERFSETEVNKSSPHSTPTAASAVSGSTAYTDSAASSPVTAASVASSRTSAGPPGPATPSTASPGSGASGLTTTIPNLPQAPAVPPSGTPVAAAGSSHSKPPGGGGSNPGGGSRSNRNNAGRKQHGHDGHHSKPICFPQQTWANKFNHPLINREAGI